ncbi:MAG TPA: CHASE3 domain-containing protein, partial [Ignavibacteria bacterium]
MKALEKKHINAVFVAAFIILVAVNIVTYLNIRLHLDDEAVINYAFTAIQISESLLSDITEAETSRRGYFITNDMFFLKQHYSAINDVDSVFKILKNEVKKNDRQIDMIDSLGFWISNRKYIWKESIVTQETKDLRDQISFTTKGREVQERIKLLISRFQEEERNILNQRLKEADTSASYTLISQICGSIIAYILLITGVLVLNKNISKRKLVEDSLWESRNWFETTLQSIGDGVIVTGKAGEIVFMNKVSENVTGWKEIEAKGLILDHIFKVVDEKTGVKPKELVNIIFDVPLTGKIIGGVQLKPKKGLSIPIEFSASSLIQNQEKPIGNVYVFRDISERRKAEKELLDNKKFIQRIADSIPSIIYSYSLKGPQLKYVNYKIVDLLGYSPTEAMRVKIDFFSKLIHPDDLSRLLSRYKKFLNANDSET